MSASEDLALMLAEGDRLIPDLLKDDGENAPDLEAYLKALHLSTDVHLSLLKLRAAEYEAAMGSPDGLALSVEQAMVVLLSTPIQARRALVERLDASIPKKGMVGP